ncbi:MAG: hypothetical protein K1X94_31885, partial [Sandaracinaceae bacterium]|nr:hypothetical protein [Sandaracinaceae bacterium]
MRRALRHLGVGALVLEAGLAPWLTACGSAEWRALDASPGLSLDGGARSAEDGAVAALDGGPLVPSFEGQSADGVADASQCFNGVDEDSNGLIDCAESACAATAACCVGSTSAACCAEDVSATLELATCPSGSPAACTTLGARVVSGTPLIAADHSVVPVARTGLDGALDFPQHPLRLRAETVTLEASIRGPESTGQLDATAFGLWAPSLPATSIEPIVAVVVSATRNDVSVVVRNRVVLHTARVAGEHAYTIAVSPSGEATISIDGTELGTVTVPLPDTASLPIVFGRVDNDDAVGGTTRLTSLALRQGACAQLAGLVRGGALLRTDLPGLDEAQTTDPSVARHGDVVRIAFAALEGSGNTARSMFGGKIQGDT